MKVHVYITNLLWRIEVKTQCSQITECNNCMFTQKSIKARKVNVHYLPRASETRFGSVSAPRMNVNNPIIPNWSCTIPGGMDTVAVKNKNIDADNVAIHFGQ